MNCIRFKIFWNDFPTFKTHKISHINVYFWALKKLEALAMLGPCFYIVIRSSEAGEKFAESNILGSSMETAFKEEDARIRNAF